jgi:hypothetical protein
MSRYGERLKLPLEIPEGESITAECPSTGEVYYLVKDRVTMVEASSKMELILN